VSPIQSARLYNESRRKLSNSAILALATLSECPLIDKIENYAQRIVGQGFHGRNAVAEVGVQMKRWLGHNNVKQLQSTLSSGLEFYERNACNKALYLRFRVAQLADTGCDATSGYCI
jgi:hypothetical protein